MRSDPNTGFKILSDPDKSESGSGFLGTDQEPGPQPISILLQNISLNCFLVDCSVTFFMGVRLESNIYKDHNHINFRK